MSKIVTLKSSVTDHEAHNLSMQYTIDILEKHGNVVSKAQWIALYQVLGSFVSTIALPEQKRRTAFPLPCGAGKTTAIRGFCKAINELDRAYKIVVCAGKIEALCELKRDLIADDVPEAKISLLHSYQHDPKFISQNPEQGTASEPSNSDDLNELRQIVLLSHAKLHYGYNKMPYDLLIHDETLFVGQGAALQLDTVIGEICKFIGQVRIKERAATDDQKALAGWLMEVDDKLSNASDDEVLKFPDLPIPITDARKADKAIHGHDDILRNFFKLIHEGYEMRMLRDKSQGSSLITIKQTIPDHMNNICILDASYNIRKVMLADKTINAMYLHENIKDHSDVTIYHAYARAGRTSIMEGLQQHGGDINLFHEVAELIARLLKVGRNVLMFTFKDVDNRKPISKLRELITKYLDGVDPDMLSAGGKLEILTWGYETALNTFSDCDAVVFAGLLTLPHSTSAANYLAHARDIKKNITKEVLNEIVQSEKVHYVYQALSRGSCRVMENGKARKMDAYIFSNDHLKLKKALMIAMPGVKFVPYQTKHLKLKASKREQCKNVFLNELAKLEVNEISLKVLYGFFSEAGSDTKKAALDEILEDTFEWYKQGRSLYRFIDDEIILSAA